MVDWAISCAAWQHELGTQVPHIQEMADMHCNLRKEASLLRKITGSELFRRGLDTLEVTNENTTRTKFFRHGTSF